MFNQYFLLNSYYPDLHEDNRNPEAPLFGYDPEKARKLLADAGWTPGPDGILAKDGQRFEITLPTASADLRHYNVYLQDLKKAGILARIEQISQSTLSKRIDEHQFDLFWSAWGASRLRDPEASWHSSTADQQASNNYPGLKDNVVDGFIVSQKTEMDLAKRNDLLRKLDTRLSELVPYVLLWQADHTRLLYWNRFGTPKSLLDKYNREDAIIPYWFVDPDKEKALAEAREQNRSLPVDTGEVRYNEE
jgi:microcin C transport system substrate-binding protein